MKVYSRPYVRKIVNGEEIHTLPLLKSPEPFRKGEEHKDYFVKEMYIKKKVVLLFFLKQLHGTLLIVMTGTRWPGQSYSFLIRALVSKGVQ